MNAWEAKSIAAPIREAAMAPQVERLIRALERRIKGAAHTGKFVVTLHWKKPQFNMEVVGKVKNHFSKLGYVAASDYDYTISSSSYVVPSVSGATYSISGSSLSTAYSGLASILPTASKPDPSHYITIFWEHATASTPITEIDAFLKGKK